MMNEPYLQQPSDAELFYQCWTEQRALMRSIDDRPLSIRFALGHSPWSGNFSKTLTFQLCDYIAINEYLDPADPAYTRWGGTWTMFDDCVSDCKQADVPLIITEFGSDTGSDEDKRVWYERSLARFRGEGISVAYSWAWQTTSPTSERFNIAVGQTDEAYTPLGKPAFYELLKAAGLRVNNCWH
jgi:hypothetical protein